MDMDLIARMGDAKTEGWQLVREGKVREFLAASERLDALCEQFRRKHFPKAREVFVVCDRSIGQPLTVYRCTPTGRPVLVYDEERP